MMLDEIITTARKGVEELSHDPRVQLDLLNIRIAMQQLQIYAMIDDLRELKQKRRELIREVLK